MTIPNKSQYPKSYDTEYELKTVVDGLYSRLTSPVVPYNASDSTTYDWENGKGILFLDDTSYWPDSGYATIYLSENHLKADKRACLFHYESKDNSSLLNVTILPNQSIKYFPEESIVVQNVVAQNHNYNKDAILNLEKYLGNRGTEDSSTIEWFTDFYSKNVRVPKPWLEVYPTNIFVGEFVTIKDQTTRINPGFEDQQDNSVKWIFNLQEAVIEVSLDNENKEYIFDYQYLDNEGNNISSQERKSTWNGEIRYKFHKSGNKNISLYVENQFGSDQLNLKEIIKVIENIPKQLDIDIYGPESDNASENVRCKAIEDQVVISSSLSTFQDTQIAPSGYIWDIPFIDNDLIPSSPYLRLSFDRGGLYDIGLKVITTNDSWIGKFLDNAIDVYEKPSVWIGHSSNTTGNFTLNEYAINGSSWKQTGINYNLDIDDILSEATIDNSRNISVSVKDSKGFHSISNSEDAYLIWASSIRDLNIAKYNALSNVISQDIPEKYLKLYNWYSLYMPVFDSSRIYVLGGITDLNDFSTLNQEISYYDISSKSFSVVTQGFVVQQKEDLKILPNGFYVTSDNKVLNENYEEIEGYNLSGINIDALPVAQSYNESFSDAQDMISNPNSYLCRWKISNYSGKGYILRNSDSSLLEDFFSFDPSLNIFSTVNSNVPFSKYEFGFQALNDGIYVISNQGDLYKYDPDSSVWNTTTNTSVSNYTNNFHSSSAASMNPNASLVSGGESRSINSSNSELYFSYDFSYDAFGKFDNQTISFQKLPERPSYDSNLNSAKQWGMIKH